MSFLVYPDMDLVWRSNSRKFRLSAVVRDLTGDKFGLFARHTLADVNAKDVCTRNGYDFLEYNPEMRGDFGAESDLSQQLYKMKMHDQFFQPNNILYDTIWPRNYVEGYSLLGKKVFLAHPTFEQIGRVTMTHAVVSLPDSEGKRKQEYTGAIVVTLSDPSAIRAGMVGAQILTSSGELVGFSIARRKDTSSDDLIVCSANKALRLRGMTLWAPPGAHWTDLKYRIQGFKDFAAENEFEL